MKKEIRVLVLFALFVSVVIGSVALGGVRSNAEAKDIPTGYVTDGLAHFYDAAGQSSGATLVDYKGTADGTVTGTASIDSNGLHITKSGSVYANDAVDMFQGDFTAEFYIQDFKRGSDIRSYIFTVGKENLGAYFHVGVWHDTDRFMIKKDSTEHNLDFMNATSNLQDALVSIVYDKTNTTMKFYLNGALLKSINHSTISAISSDANYVQIGDDSGYWATETFKSIRFYNKALTSDQIRINYEVDYSKYSKNIDHENNMVIVPSWRDYKYSTNGTEHLKGYFAGQDPLITGYEYIIRNALSDANNDNLPRGKIESDDFEEIKKSQFKSKPYNQLWQNLANPVYGTALFDDAILTLTSDKVTDFKLNYIDKDGYHSDTSAYRIELFHKTADFEDSSTYQKTDTVKATVKNWVGTSDFTIEIFLGDFKTVENANNYHALLYMPGSSGDDEFLLYYDSMRGELAIKCPTRYADNSKWRAFDSNYRPRYQISLNALKDSLLTIVFDQDNFYKLYLNGKEFKTTNGYGTFSQENLRNRANTSGDQVLIEETGHPAQVVANNINLKNPGWDRIYLGGYQAGNNEKMFPAKCTYRCVRVYDTALTDTQIAANYANDDKLYHKTTTTDYKTPEKQTTSYGLVGFDKILENNNLFVGKEIKFTQDNITNDNGNGGYVNELLNDWEPATGLYITKTERLKYFVASLNNGEKDGTKTYKRTPIRIDQRATFYDFSTFLDHRTDFFRGRMEGTTLAITDSGMGERFARTHDENGVKKIDEWYENNAALAIQNSFYMRSKYKCGDSSIKVEDGKIVDSTKLMITADIMPDTLKDTNFCGMVIDFSDDIWNRYDPNMDYSGYEWTGHARDDSMYTHYDNGAGEDDGYCRTSLFETGVGFNLVRTANEEEGRTDTYEMRVFVGGDGSANSTKYKDIEISKIQALNNYTIYREYTTWPFATTTLNDWTLTKDTTNVYLVKFYVNKKMVAIVVMGIGNNTTLSEGSSPLAGATGYIIPVNDGNLDVNNKLKTCTFKDWRHKCNYGINGKHVENPTDNSDPRNATASGNILFAVNRKNNMFSFAENANGSSDGYQMTATDENCCHVIIDNIGYMDYHDTETQKTYSGSFSVNQDMTFNLASSLIFARKVFEPEIYFNRLGYSSSREKFSDFANKAAYEKRLSEDKDFKAGHGQAVIKTNGNLAGDSKITMYSNNVDGVYFKDIADKITYDFIDFNGETMFTKELKAIDYFKTLYENYKKDIDAGKTPEMTKNQINLMLDIIELGEAISKYSGYYRLADQEAGKIQGIGRLEDFSVTNDKYPDGVGIDDLSMISSEDAFNLLNVKPEKSSSGTSKTAKFIGFNIYMKSYISILTKVQVPGSWANEMENHFKVYYKDGEAWNPYDLVIYGDDIIGYHADNSNCVQAIQTVEDIAGSTDKYVTLEIKLSIMDFDKQFKFELVETDRTYIYGLYNYCQAKWNNTNNTNKNLSELVQRLFHVGELAQHYYDEVDYPL